MLTLIGMKKIKDKIVAMGQPQDAEVNAILQQAVIQLNRLTNTRYSK